MYVIVKYDINRALLLIKLIFYVEAEYGKTLKHVLLVHCVD